MHKFALLQLQKSECTKLRPRQYFMKGSDGFVEIRTCLGSVLLKLSCFVRRTEIAIRESSRISFDTVSADFIGEDRIDHLKHIMDDVCV